MHGRTLVYLSLEKVHEWSINANAHPLHVHINPFQVVETGGAGAGGIADWHQVGDWYDVFLGSGTVRFRTDKFAGKVVMHCHLLEHEDEGCMAVAEIIADATEYSGQTCFTDNQTLVPGVAVSSTREFAANLHLPKREYMQFFSKKIGSFSGFSEIQ